MILLQYKQIYFTHTPENQSVKMIKRVYLNPRERIGFAELSRQVGIGPRLLAAGLASIKYKIPYWGSKISCAELHIVPVPQSLLRGSSIPYQNKFVLGLLS